MRQSGHIGQRTGLKLRSDPDVFCLVFLLLGELLCGIAVPRIHLLLPADDPRDFIFQGAERAERHGEASRASESLEPPARISQPSGCSIPCAPHVYGSRVLIEVKHHGVVLSVASERCSQCLLLWHVFSSQGEVKLNNRGDISLVYLFIYFLEKAVVEGPFFPPIRCTEYALASLNC